MSNTKSSIKKELQRSMSEQMTESIVKEKISRGLESANLEDLKQLCAMIAERCQLASKCSAGVYKEAQDFAATFFRHALLKACELGSNKSTLAAKNLDVKNILEKIKILFEYTQQINFDLEDRKEVWGKAIMQGSNIEMLQALLNGPYGLTIDFRLAYDMTGLMWAARKGHATTVAFLLEKGAVSSLVSSPHQMTALHFVAEATKYGVSPETTVIIAKYLLDANQSSNKVNVNAKDVTGTTALMVAVGRNNLALVKCLLALGADPRICNNKSFSVLQQALILPNADVLRQLCSASRFAIDINIRYKSGLRLLDQAILCENKEAILCLLTLSKTDSKECAVNPNEYLDFLFPQDFDELSNKRLNLFIEANKEANRLVNNRPQLNFNQYLINRNLKPLALVAVRCSLSGLKALIQNGADINFQDEHVATPLILAASFRYSDCVDTLLQAGADVNLTFKDGENALMAVLMEDNAKKLESRPSNVKGNLREINKQQKAIVLRLIEHKVNLDCADNDGYTALWYAVQHNVGFAVELLLKHGAKMSSLPIQVFMSRTIPDYHPERNHLVHLIELAATHASAESLLALLDSDAWKQYDVKSKPKILFYALCKAIRTGSTACMNRLLNEKELDVNMRIPELLNQPVLRFALDKSINITELLLNHQADVNIKGPEGTTLLAHDAASKQNTEMLKLLLKNGIKVDEQDKHGGTALIRACHKGHKAGVELLLENKASSELYNKNGINALGAAILGDHPEIVAMLVNANKNIIESNKRLPLSAIESAKSIKMLKTLKEYGITGVPHTCLQLVIEILMYLDNPELLSGFLSYPELLSVNQVANKLNNTITWPVYYAANFPNCSKESRLIVLENKLRSDYPQINKDKICKIVKAIDRECTTIKFKLDGSLIVYLRKEAQNKSKVKLSALSLAKLVQHTGTLSNFKDQLINVSKPGSAQDLASDHKKDLEAAFVTKPENASGNAEVETTTAIEKTATAQATTASTAATKSTKKKKDKRKKNKNKVTSDSNQANSTTPEKSIAVHDVLDSKNDYEESALLSELIQHESKEALEEDENENTENLNVTSEDFEQPEAFTSDYLFRRTANPDIFLSKSKETKQGCEEKKDNEATLSPKQIAQKLIYRTALKGDLAHILELRKKFRSKYQEEWPIEVRNVLFHYEEALNEWPEEKLATLIEQVYEGLLRKENEPCSFDGMKREIDSDNFLATLCLKSKKIPQYEKILQYSEDQAKVLIDRAKGFITQSENELEIYGNYIRENPDAVQGDHYLHMAIGFSLARIATYVNKIRSYTNDKTYNSSYALFIPLGCPYRHADPIWKLVTSCFIKFCLERKPTPQLQPKSQLKSQSQFQAQPQQQPTEIKDSKARSQAASRTSFNVNNVMSISPEFLNAYITMLESSRARGHTSQGQTAPQFDFSNSSRWPAPRAETPAPKTETTADGKKKKIKTKTKTISSS